MTISAAASDGGLELTVDDSGAGLTPEQQRAVFEPFWRGDGSRSTRGSGLGLTLAQRITHALGGEIRVSRSAAGGARFSVLVPPDPATVASTILSEADRTAQSARPLP